MVSKHHQATSHTASSLALQPQANHPADDHSKFLTAWISWRESGLHRRKWASTYKELQLLYINKYFQTYQLINANNLEECLTLIPSESRSKRKHIHSVVSSFADFLQQRGLLSRDEYFKIRLLHPKKNHYEKPKQNIISKEQLNALIEQASTGHQRYQATLNFTLVIFLAQTGLRVSEASNLSINDIHFGETPYVLVRCGKGGKARKVPFSRLAQEVVRDYLKVRPTMTESENLFLAFNPKHGYTPITKDCVARRFRLLRQKTGIAFTAHSFRHFFITSHANNPRCPIAVVQQWAGHSSLVMTQHYVHINEDEALKLAYDL
jgi:integrase